MSESMSAENLPNDAQAVDGGRMCIELALEGERLCREGDCSGGISFFLAALQAGTDDRKTLSAIYSQLGNAYFYIGDYNKAMEFHKYDLIMAKSMGDKLGEAKASGNLGNTLKVMGKFEDAIQCCKLHLEISRAAGDKHSEGRALYNLGNVYHAQGKHLSKEGQNDPGNYPEAVRECFLQAKSYYVANLELMRKNHDYVALGRACGNLGNTCYLLGDFNSAITYHKERLDIAQYFKDKAAERRASSNLGNSHIFLGQFQEATEHYKRTLAIAEEMGDAAVEAQACYSLGNTYTMMREYRVAEEYHARHLEVARKLKDRVGEGRACWSLGNANAALGNHEKALYYANEHYTISTQLADTIGIATAQMNIADLRKVLGLPQTEEVPEVVPEERPVPSTPISALRVRRQSMEQLSLIQITPDSKFKMEEENEVGQIPGELEDDDFFKLLHRCQSQRMEEQRATLNDIKEKTAKKAIAKKQRPTNGDKNAKSNERMLELISNLQSRRIDGQRSELPRTSKANPTPPVSTAQPAGPAPSAVPAPSAPSASPAQSTTAATLPGLRAHGEVTSKPEESFIDILHRLQGARLNDQRTELPVPTASTVPDDDFFAILMRAQSQRIESQRAEGPSFRAPDVSPKK